MEDLEFLVGNIFYLIIQLDYLYENMSQDVRINYLESIFNLSDIHEIISDLCNNGLIKTLSELLKMNLHIDVIRLSLKIIDKVLKNRALSDSVHRFISVGEVVAKMNVHKDLESAKHAFHIINLLTLNAKIHSTI